MLPSRQALPSTRWRALVPPPSLLGPTSSRAAARPRMYRCRQPSGLRAPTSSHTMLHAVTAVRRHDRPCSHRAPALSPPLPSRVGASKAPAVATAVPAQTARRRRRRRSHRGSTPSPLTPSLPLPTIAEAASVPTTHCRRAPTVVYRLRRCSHRVSPRSPPPVVLLPSSPRPSVAVVLPVVLLVAPLPSSPAAPRADTTTADGLPALVAPLQPPLPLAVLLIVPPPWSQRSRRSCSRDDRRTSSHLCSGERGYRA